VVTSAGARATGDPVKSSAVTFSRSEADVYVPDGRDPMAACARVTHLCIGAHQDDIEILAHDAICDCLDAPHERGFGGVVVTDGGGSPRTGRYAAMDDAEMRQVRAEEQRAAARLGQYAVQIQLAHPSADVKRPGHAGVAADFARLFEVCRPQVVYLHNPADKHDTHVAVFLRCLAALRAVPAERRPRRVLGAEVWRGLDWLLDSDKIALDAGRRPELADQLLQVFDSQVGGGKRYDAAAAGRRSANATFHTSHATDRFAGITWAMDLTPLIHDPALDVGAYVLGYIDRLRADVAARLARFS
ncbi:MAG TPA: PIG-L family deacetylase, partial [Candidatus Synoicihabitans sp.]|nr:PIG-L family deacetylase [Candidatus Synoicihabitans sp.]